MKPRAAKRTGLSGEPFGREGSGCGGEEWYPCLTPRPKKVTSVLRQVKDALRPCQNLPMQAAVALVKPKRPQLAPIDRAFSVVLSPTSSR
jgi:hypothetical protein